MVATIATRQLHFFFSSSFPIEEKRTNPFPIGFHPSFPTIFKLHAMVNKFQIFLPSLPLSIFKYFRNCGRERENDELMMTTIATRQLRFFFSPFPKEEEEERTIFELHATINRFQIFLPSLSLPIFEYFRNCGREREKRIGRRKNEPFPTTFHPSSFQQFSYFSRIREFLRGNNPTSCA